MPLKQVRYYLYASLLVTCVYSLVYAQPKGLSQSEATRLKLTTVEGELNCTLNANSEVVAQIMDEIKAKRLDGSFICRSVMDYFVQIGCRKSTMSNTEKKPLGFDLPRTGSHKEAGTLSAVKSAGDFGRIQLVVMLRPATWLDGSQTVIGHCSNLELMKRIARKPTVAGGKPRQPTQIITAEILGPESNKRRNGLAK